MWGGGEDERLGRLLLLGEDFGRDVFGSTDKGAGPLAGSCGTVLEWERKQNTKNALSPGRSSGSTTSPFPRSLAVPKSVTLIRILSSSRILRSRASARFRRDEGGRRLLGLEVAVDHALAVHVLDGAEDLRGVESCRGEGEGAKL